MPVKVNLIRDGNLVKETTLDIHRDPAGSSNDYKWKAKKTYPQWFTEMKNDTLKDIAEDDDAQDRKALSYRAEGNKLGAYDTVPLTKAPINTE